MQDRNRPQAVENYQGAFLVTAGVLLFMALWTLASLAGFLWVLVVAGVIDRLIWLGHRFRS